MKHFFTCSLLVLSSLSIFNSCSHKKEASVSIIENTGSFDSLVVHQTYNKQLLGKLKTEPNSFFKVAITAPIVAIAELAHSATSRLLIIEPGETNELIIDSLGIHSLSVADSLINYLSTSSNQIIAENGHLISSAEKSTALLKVYDSLINARSLLIDSTAVSDEVKQLLKFDNKNRAYNFLFFYGRVIHSLMPADEFFNFIHNISYSDTFNRTSPYATLYKMEISYLRQYDSISSLTDFTSYIDAVVEDTDAADYYRASYMKSLIEIPQYWEKHQQIFNSLELKAFLKKEASNPYASLFNEGSKSYFSAMKGEKAYEFTAIAADGSTFNLSSLSNKFVIIDAWATWCGPCIKQKPYFEALAHEFKESELVFLSVSIDESYSNWKKYMDKHMDKNEPEHIVKELYLGDELEKFKAAYNVQSIPRYIFINKGGEIIDADMEDLGLGMARRIQTALQ
jgi:thiol-disulfide isomerase/thioredoxin